MSNPFRSPWVAGASALMCISIIAATSLLLVEEEQDSAVVTAAAEAISAVVVSHRNKTERGHDEAQYPSKRRAVAWNRERAAICIEEDYLGAVPKFSMDDFKRIFRVSRSVYNSIRNHLCESVPFFLDGYDATKRQKICTDAKILIALKCLAYGSSVNSFRDYFQLGESTARLCVEKFTHGIVDDEQFRQLYFRSMTPSDARRVEAMHFDQHGIHGMAGSLDCTHIGWNNCPVAHQGQFKGKEEKPTLIMEAVSDHQLFAWHSVVGYAGTLNDINVWDSSLLHKPLIDGSFCHNDFEYSIGGEQFNKLWFLVDGIYPPLTRFVGPMSVPILVSEALYSSWQESSRKDVEHFFGVLKKKFHVMKHGTNSMSLKNIIAMVNSCVMLHNMMVVERIHGNDDSIEDGSFYDLVDAEVEGNAPTEDEATAFVNMQEENIARRLLEVEYLEMLGIHVHDSSLRDDMGRASILPQLTRMAQYRWTELYDMAGNQRLKKAIMKELERKYKAAKGIN